jgi:hypothetical protein
VFGLVLLWTANDKLHRQDLNGKVIPLLFQEEIHPSGLGNNADRKIYLYWAKYPNNYLTLPSLPSGPPILIRNINSRISCSSNNHAHKGKETE